MATEPDVARVAAAFNAPGLRYRSFGNKPVRNDAPRREFPSQNPEAVLRELRGDSALRMIDGETVLPPPGGEEPGAGFRQPFTTAPSPAPAVPVPFPVAAAPVVMATPLPVPPAMRPMPMVAIVPPPAPPVLPAATEAVPEFSLLASINAALEAPPVPSRPVADGTLARLRRQVAERPPSPPSGVAGEGAVLIPAVTFPLGEVMRAMAEAAPPAASPIDTFGAAPRSSSPF